MTIKRGDIVYIKGCHCHDCSVQAGDRPAIIVSNDKANIYSDVVEVVFLTSARKTPLPTHVNVSALVKSTALCEQVHSVSKSRIDRRFKTCTKYEMKAIDKALKISLALTNN